MYILNALGVKDEGASPRTGSISLCVYLCVSVWLTVCHLQLGFGHDAACDSQRLADIIPSIRALNGWDGQLSVDGHGHTSSILIGLVGKQKILQGDNGRGVVTVMEWRVIQRFVTFDLWSFWSEYRVGAGCELPRGKFIISRWYS